MQECAAVQKGCGQIGSCKYPWRLMSWKSEEKEGSAIEQQKPTAAAKGSLLEDPLSKHSKKQQHTHPPPEPGCTQNQSMAYSHQCGHGLMRNLTRIGEQETGPEKGWENPPVDKSRSLTHSCAATVSNARNKQL